MELLVSSRPLRRHRHHRAGVASHQRRHRRSPSRMDRSNVERRRCSLPPSSSRRLRLAHVWIRNTRLDSPPSSRVALLALAVAVCSILPVSFGDTPRLRRLPQATQDICRPSALRPSVRPLLASATANLPVCMAPPSPPALRLVVLRAPDRCTRLLADDRSRLGALLRPLGRSLGRRRHRLVVALEATPAVRLVRLVHHLVTLLEGRSASPTSLVERPIRVTPIASFLLEWRRTCLFLYTKIRPQCGASDQTRQHPAVESPTMPPTPQWHERGRRAIQPHSNLS